MCLYLKEFLKTFHFCMALYYLQLLLNTNVRVNRGSYINVHVLLNLLSKSYKETELSNTTP